MNLFLSLFFFSIVFINSTRLAIADRDWNEIVILVLWLLTVGLMLLWRRKALRWRLEKVQAENKLAEMMTRPTQG